MNVQQKRSLLWFVAWLAVAAAVSGVLYYVKGFRQMPGGVNWMAFVGLIAGLFATIALLNWVTHAVLARQRRPTVEGEMIGRLYWLLGFIGFLVFLSYGFGVMGTFGTIFSLFGGMLLGWSLQAPVSGFAAYLLVSLKRPFRPGDRVQFPNLGLTGDVKEIGAMYTVLNQVGGAISSEEAVGRYILVPNAMLFNQVAINYTVSQDAAYMLDEAVIRITFDSDWKVAEQILLKAAKDVTSDIIEATGEEPYIRADPYDYGVFLRLRYRTRVQDRVEISYRINKLVFEEIQRTPSVDIAIPFIYSYRAGFDRKEEFSQDREAQHVTHLPMERITNPTAPYDPRDVEQLMHSIRKEGLLQPILVSPKGASGCFDILAGHLRYYACQKLGWKFIPAVIRGNGDTAVPQAVKPTTSA